MNPILRTLVLHIPTADRQLQNPPSPDRRGIMIDTPIGRGAAFGKKPPALTDIDRPNAVPLHPGETFPV